mmetsp:Transcript_56355/g.92634  ORF Transcript_56355/g.92634 Transcript_56355/m.92634 type:complete len:84 (-) Transcript_56355:37-288(-)
MGDMNQPMKHALTVESAAVDLRQPWKRVLRWESDRQNPDAAAQRCSTTDLKVKIECKKKVFSDDNIPQNLKAAMSQTHLTGAV